MRRTASVSERGAEENGSDSVKKQGNCKLKKRVNSGGEGGIEKRAKNRVVCSYIKNLEG